LCKFGRGVFPQVAPAHPPDARPPFHPQGGTALARSPAARSCRPQTDGTSCPGLLCSALGRCRADRASHVATPAPAGYVLNRQTGFHAPLLSSLTAQTHTRKKRSCVPHSRGHRPLLWLSHASHRTLADSLLSALVGRLLSSCAGRAWHHVLHVVRQPTA